ncbi:hypothetical protein [Pleionea sp. CnH1-48]|uniref:hypothetical protein n=1 Tax=Pleionea sp. CnH1-48 TaxID=2954494 RepID=UPI0020974CB0|nr:hypothetical protein [Pleionea sp. CnH1-48]MCO7223509.1 hypothetical protein [Pleionea sp. CnH1-48]
MSDIKEQKTILSRLCRLMCGVFFIALVMSSIFTNGFFSILPLTVKNITLSVFVWILFVLSFHFSKPDPDQRNVKATLVIAFVGFFFTPFLILEAAPAIKHISSYEYKELELNIDRLAKSSGRGMCSPRVEFDDAGILFYPYICLSNDDYERLISMQKVCAVVKASNVGRSDYRLKQPLTEECT